MIDPQRSSTRSVHCFVAYAITVIVDGEPNHADLIIENGAGRWYGVDLGGGDWDYLQDNGEYVPVPEVRWHPARYTYQLVDHPKSGETYALRLWGEVTIIGLCGPLDATDLAEAQVFGRAALEYDVTDLDWAASVQWRPHYEAGA